MNFLHLTKQIILYDAGIYLKVYIVVSSNTVKKNDCVPRKCVASRTQLMRLKNHLKRSVKLFYAEFKLHDCIFYLFLKKEKKT